MVVTEKNGYWNLKKDIEDKMKRIILKFKREKSLLRKHPWVFSGAIETVKGNPVSGDTIEIFSFKGNWIARGSYSEKSQIRVRVWTFLEEEKIDSDFFERTIQKAYKNRKFILKGISSSAYRIVNAESDNLPGLIIDRYNDIFVCQFLSAGAEKWKPVIVEAIKKIFSPESIYERSDVAIRKKEGLIPIKGLLYGKEPDDLITILEDKVRLFVDVKNGHKTGYYLDQRESRISIGKYCQNADVLNCFSYSGGFGIHALNGEAKSIVNVDSSAPALELAEKNQKLNKLQNHSVEYVVGDVFKVLREYREIGKQFDVIILDPPKFVDSKYHLNKAARGYKDINMLAFQLLKVGGFLFTFSCSGLMTSDLFQKIVSDAALDANCETFIVKRFSQAMDHSVSTNFPEGYYLKGLLLQKKI